jgi:hypothetical protein
LSLLGQIDHQCKPTQFACSSFGSVEKSVHNDACILNSFLCDGDDDCENGTDEQLDFCGMYVLYLKPLEFLSKNSIFMTDIKHI